MLFVFDKLLPIDFTLFLGEWVWNDCTEVGVVCPRGRLTVGGTEGGELVDLKLFVCWL